MASRRISLIVVAALGVFVAHQAAYGLSEFLTPGVGTPDHGYLAIAVQLVVPAGVCALILLVLRAARKSLDLGGLTILTLTVAQIGLFLTQETIEAALSGGTSGLITNPAVWIGIAIQPLIAAAILGAVRLGASAVRRLHAPTTRPPTRRAPSVFPPGELADTFITVCNRLGPRRRGPPVLA